MKLQGIREAQKCHLIQMSKDNNFLILGISFQCLCSNVEFGKFQIDNLFCGIPIGLYYLEFACQN